MKTLIFHIAPYAIAINFACLPTHAGSLNGNVHLTSNYLEKGISESDNKAALASAIHYQFAPQVKFGIDAVSVKYTSDNSHLRLTPFTEFKINFAQSVDLLLSYHLHQYYGSTSRNGNTITIDLNTFDYHAVIERDDNFEGSQSERSWYGFRKTGILSTYIYSAELGYSSVSSSTYSSYFSAAGELGYKWTSTQLLLGISLNSNSSQFGDSGNNTVYAKFMVVF